MTETQTLPVIGHFLDGRVLEDSARRSPVFDPATGVHQKDVALADPALVDQAVRSAAEAQLLCCYSWKTPVRMSVSAALKSRVRRPSYLSKIAKAEDLLHHFPNGAYVGWSGFTGVGYPKYV